MQVNISGAKFSSIVGIGENIRSLSKKNGKEYLMLNRGINSVCNIELTEVVKYIDFNSNDIQVYPTAQGRHDLRKAINKVYFNNLSDIKNISITGGGMSGLDLVFQTLNLKKIFLPEYYWGSYYQIITIREKQYDFYGNFDEILEEPEKYKGSAVIICDPNNPVGDKYDENKLLNLISVLNDIGAYVITDSPYRRVFFDDNDKLYANICNKNNVIIVESFSKSVGLSGQRIGFVHTCNEEFNKELVIRLMYATNGINSFAQILVNKLLTTKEGIEAVNKFKDKTTKDIALNIKYLQTHKLLAEKFYKNTEPKGIFVIVNKSEEELLNNYIGSVSLSYFTRTKKEEAKKYARICVSMPHEKFTFFFDNLLKAGS